MSDEIALFPLSNVALFPRLRIPLHVFEPRYRQLTQHELAGDRRIGMIAVPPERAAQLAGDPPIYPIGCAGIISAAQQLPDGRFHIVLDGIWRFRVVEEPPRPPERLYRLARVERLPEPYDPSERAGVARLRERIFDLVRRLLAAADRDESRVLDPEPFGGMDDEAFVNTLSNALALAPPEKQGLLEAPSIPARFERLEGLLAFRLAEIGLPGPRAAGRLH